MTPGLAIALFGAAVCAAIWWLALLRGRRDAAAAALWVIAGLGLARLIKIGAPPDAHLIALGAIWVAVGGIVLRRGLRVAEVPCAGAGGLLIASGLCYAVADAVGAAMAIWSPVMMAADFLGFLAVGALLWGASGGKRVGTDHRVARAFLGANRRRGGLLAGCAGLGLGRKEDTICRGAGRGTDTGEVA